MKTITMDYDLYVSELLAERKRGFEFRPNLLNVLTKLAESIGSRNHDEYLEAERSLFKLIADIKRSESYKSEHYE